MDRKQTVVIPEFNHSTIQQILETNQRIIKILMDLQNQGFHGTQEQRIYQIRLQTNLTFLATIADALFGKVGVGSKEYQSGEYEEACVPTEPVRSVVVKSLPPPVRIQIATDSITKPTYSTYYPIPPLVGQNPVQEMSLSGYTILDTNSSHSILLQETSESKDVIGKKRQAMAAQLQHRPVLLQAIQEDSDSEDTDYKVSDSDTEI
jgi:hypothetical protein